MSETKIELFRDEFDNIVKTLKKFPDAESVSICVDDSSGIGKLTNIVIPIQINGIDGELKIPITTVENW